MSIIFKTITIRNFLSVGAVCQTINFDNSNFTLILGENLDLGGDGFRNGVGKSTMMQALSYVLFGTPISNIRKDNLINRTNGKQMLVTLDFTVNDKEYRIERGRKPNILRFYVNKEQQRIQDDAQGENKATQEDIERILSMSGDLFKHIVSLNTYTEPFLAMGSNDQRAIIEQLLGVTILSEKAETLKQLLKETKDAIQMEEFRVKVISDANKRMEETIENIVRRQKLWQTKHDEDLTKLALQYDELSKINITEELQLHKDLAVYNEAVNLKSLQDSSIASLKKEITKEEKNHTKLVSEITLLKENKCYACGQDFHDENHTKVLENKISLLTECETHLNSLKENLSELTSNPVVVPQKPKTHYDLEADAIKHENTLGNLESQIEKKLAEIDPYEEQIVELKNQSVQKIDFSILNDLNSKLDHQKFILDLLTNKDSFVRKKIIDQNLSYLNRRLTHYLEKMGLPHQVVFKNDLSVEITELGRDLDFGNLSRGEASRLILGLSFSFRDVWECLYRPINILMIDELMDSGLDTAGVENTMSILKEMNRARKKSIWLISHREELTSRVSKVLKVIKEGGFTTYCEE